MSQRHNMTYATANFGMAPHFMQTRPCLGAVPAPSRASMRHRSTEYIWNDLHICSRGRCCLSFGRLRPQGAAEKPLHRTTACAVRTPTRSSRHVAREIGRSAVCARARAGMAGVRADVDANPHMDMVSSYSSLSVSLPTETHKRIRTRTSEPTRRTQWRA